MPDKISKTQPLRIDEYLTAIKWPKLKKTRLPAIEKDDCLLLCGGFEDRATEALRRLCAAEKDEFAVGLIEYLPTYEQNKTEEIRRIARRSNLRVKEFTYDRQNPANMGNVIKDFAHDFDHIFIDISGMSRLLIVQTLVALLLASNRPITVIYSEAEDYPPSEDEFERDRTNSTKSSPSYLSSGIFEIATTPELSSISMLGENIRLVTFPSFDPAHLGNLLQELQPTYTDLIYGVSPVSKNVWRTQAIRELNRPTLSSLQGSKDYEACTLDYKETLHALLRIYRDRSMFDRIVVSPTGSKMQAVAVALFRAVLYDVQIVYPTPQTFTEPDRYTLGVHQLYSIDLPIDEMPRYEDVLDDPRE